MISATRTSAGCTPPGGVRRCNFSGATLSESEHTGTAFRNCRFDRAALWHSIFRQCSLLGSTFSQSRLRPITFDEVDFTLAVLGGADLRGADLSGCRLRETSLVEADLRKAVLRRADLTGARTIGMRLDDADLRGARVDPTFWTTARLPAPRSTSTRRWRMRPRTVSTSTASDPPSARRELLCCGLLVERVRASQLSAINRVNTAIGQFPRRSRDPEAVHRHRGAQQTVRSLVVSSPTGTRRCTGMCPPRGARAVGRGP